MKRVNLTYTQPQLDIFFPEVPCRHNIIPKGRRFGATRGLAHAFSEWGLEGMPMLWGDTTHSNIVKYVERYFLPLRAQGIDLDWRVKDMVLRFATDGYIDFRSAERPDNWEGFGYRKIGLNEAGIILSDPYLYTNAVRPMMMDPGGESELFALGVPKGIQLKDGRPHPFHTLYQKIGTPGYRGRTYTTFDNPLLSEEDVLETEADIASMDPQQVRQEIYGEFVQAASGRPFAFNFDQGKHGTTPCAQNPARRVAVVVDFNLEPFCALFAHVWQDHTGPHCYVFKEVSIREGTLDEMARRIRTQVPHTSLIELTGDRGGDARRLGIKTNATMFGDLIRLIPISVTQLTLRPNPTHVQSREDVNFAFAHHPDLRIDPSCTGLIRDLLTVAVDEDGEIIKRDRSKIAQQADLLDCFRYLVNAFLQDFKRSYKHALPVGREMR